MKSKRKRKSMFDNYRDLIIQKLDEGCSIKQVFEIIDHNSEFYDYNSFYTYVHKTLQYKRDKVDCEHCKYLLQMSLPTTGKQVPVCIPFRRIMRTDLKDRPFKCGHFVAEQE